MCSRIRFLPTDHQTKLETARSLAVSKAAYGWVAHTPDAKDMQKVDTAVRTCSEAFSGAAKHMHNMLLGGNKCLEIVIGVRQVLLYGKRALSENWTAAFHQTSLLAQRARVF